MTSFTLLRHSIATLVVLALFIGLRFIHLTADPPTHRPTDLQEWTELTVEGPAKAQEARNKALFGVWKTNPVDNYQFWRAQSPVWVYPLSWAFRTAGVEYATLRSFSILTSVLSLLGVLLIAARRSSGWPLIASGGFLAINYWYVFYCRSGLLEPMLNGFLAFTVLFSLLALKEPRWLVPAQLALACAFLTKQTALALLPLLLVVTVWALVRARRRGRPPWHWIAPLVTLAAVVTALGFYVVHDAYWRTVVWNFGHIFLDDTKVSGLQVSRVSAADVLARIFAWDRWRDGFFLLMPIAAPLSLLALTRIAWRAVRYRRISDWDALVSLWFVLALASLHLSSLSHLRYYVVLIPPSALLAAAGLRALLRWAASFAGTPVLGVIAASLVLGVVLTHGRWFLDWAWEPEYRLVDTNRDIATRIGARNAVIIGAWAPPLVFETRYQNYFVRESFNSSREALEALAITHLLVRRKGDAEDFFSRHDWTYWTFKNFLPEAAANAKTIATYSLWNGYSVDLRAIELLDVP